MEAAALRPGSGPERRKKRRIRRQIRALPRRSVVLAQDETDLLLFPPLRTAWSKARRRRQGLAERPQCPACDLRGDELADGDTAVCAARGRRSGAFQAFLGEVRLHYWGWHVAMLLDEVPLTRPRPPCARPRE